MHFLFAPQPVHEISFENEIAIPFQVTRSQGFDKIDLSLSIVPLGPRRNSEPALYSEKAVTA